MAGEITTYAEYLAADARQDALRSEMRGLEDRERYDQLREEHSALTDAMFNGPNGELLRICWLVDHPDKSMVPPELDENGEPNLEAYNEQRGDFVTTAWEAKWVAERLLAELRTLRPELGPAIG